MRNVLLVLLLTSAITSATARANAAEGKPAPAVDERLAQKVTYESSYKRLHSVLEDLSEMTGVTIRCGRNKNEWWIRDFPVFVSVKDMPLGKLLRTVADCTHLTLSSTKTPTTWSYRIWRNPDGDKLLGKCLEAEHDRAKAEQSWQWDRLACLADVPESAVDLSKANDETHDKVSRALAFGKLVAHLGNEARDRALSGEIVFIRPSDLPTSVKEDVMARIRRYWEKTRENRERLAGDNPGKGWDRELTPEQLERNGFVQVTRSPHDAPKLVVITGFAIGDSVNEGPSICQGTDVGYYASVADLVKGYEFPKPPSVQGPEELARSVMPLDKSLRPLESKDDWDTPLLRTKIKIEAPKDKKEVTCSEFLADVSRASGCAIICEDFYTHKVRSNYVGAYGSETTLADLLKRVKSFVWKTDEGNKVIVGWPSDWYKHHSNMVPESFLANLREKLEGGGVELDDFTPAAYFTWDQRWEWLVHNRWLQTIQWGNFLESEKLLWQLYHSLSIQDKGRAKSPDGLPLADLDRNRLSALIQNRNSDCVNDSSENPEERKKREIPTDSEVITWLVMRIKTKIPDTIEAPNPEDKTRFPNLKQAPRDFKKHVYHMEISGEVNGESRTVSIHGPLYIYFPAYSEEREAELEDE